MTGMFLNVLLFIIEIVAAELLFTFRLRKRKNFISVKKKYLTATHLSCMIAKVMLWKAL